MNPRFRITTGLVPVWRISVDPSDVEADRGISADADSVLLPVRPHLNYWRETPMIAITLPSYSRPPGANTLALALDSLKCKLCHFDAHPPRWTLIF